MRGSRSSVVAAVLSRCGTLSRGVSKQRKDREGAGRMSQMGSQPLKVNDCRPAPPGGLPSDAVDRKRLPIHIP